MAKKISQLVQATEVKSDDVTVIVQDGETKKLPLNMMVTKQDIENKKVVGLAKLDEIEATYENDTYTPTITVKNKSSVKVGEGDGVDYSANVMDGPAKSAILSGQTLVNLVNFEKSYFRTTGIINSRQGCTINFSTATTGKFNLGGKISLLKTDTKYLLKVKLECENKATTYVYLLDEDNNKYIMSNTSIKDNNYSYMFTTPSTLGNTIKLGLIRTADGGEETITASVLLIEHQEGMENWDIPYFTDMQSVKMPVLTTTGKNLFDGLSYIDGFISQGNNYTVSPDNDVTSILVNVNKNTDYILSAKTNFRRSMVGGSLTPISIGTKTTNLNSERIGNTIKFNSGIYTNIIIYLNDTKINIEDIQVEEGSTATSYEPYKTNILSVSEDVELRGIGDVRDELNLLTGEVITNTIELTVDSNTNIKGERFPVAGANFVNTSRYAINIKATFGVDVANQYGLSDKIPYAHTDEDVFHFKVGSFTNYCFIYVPISELETDDWNGFVKWAKNKNFKLLLKRSEKSVKTVDLIPSGTHPSTTPYCWKDGHIQLSSLGLLPSLEYSVVTSRAGQISQNAAMIVKNDKRIFDLEILLAGGLVNTTYQALTLQNQVETGLSKVSLSSEKEPDYLLYHMIMKLIEEKAYKLDDLAEKVSVFYLYEKLSDEQFETIYSELYPFVEEEYIELPEDGEIIEEPIVDEVLEEVENEVVM